MQKIKGWLFLGLESLYRMVARWPLAVILVSVVLAAGSLTTAVKTLTFLSNFAGLNKEDALFSQNYTAFVKEFRIEPDILVVAKGPEPEKNKAFLDALAPEIGQSPHVTRVYYKINLKPFKAWALAYPSYQELKKIRTTINLVKPLFEATDYEADLTRFWLSIPAMSRRYSQIQGDSGSIGQLRQFVDLMTSQLQGRPAAVDDPFKDLSRIQESQYITLKDGRYALLFARPISNDRGVDQVEESVKAVRDAVARVAPRYPMVEAHLTGEPVMGADEMATAKHDIFWAGIVSLVLSSAIFIFGFKEIRKPLLSVVALFVGIGWSLGYIALTVGHLNVFTLSLFPMLIGLAIDFSIQFMGRYREELSRTGSPEEAVRMTYFSTGTGLLAAALTTALGFFAISMTEYRGVAELGIATGGSLLLCFLSTMTVLPALLLATESRTGELKLAGSLAMGMRTERFLLGRARPILWMAVTLTLILGFKARAVSFDHNVLHLQAKGTDSIKTELELLDVSEKSSLFAVMVAKNSNEAESLIAQLRNLDTVSEIQSPLPFVPADQEKKFPLLRKIQEDVQDFDIQVPNRTVDVQKLAAAFVRIQAMIDQAQKKMAAATSTLHIAQVFLLPGISVIPHRTLSTNLAQINVSLGELKQSVGHFLGALQSMDPEKASTLLTQFQDTFFKKMRKSFDLLKHGIPRRPVTLGDLPPLIRNQFVGKSGKIMLQVYPAQNIWERPALERFIGQLRQVDPNVTGSPVLILESTQLIQKSYQDAAKIAFLAIVIITLLQFRNIGLTVLTLIPLGLGLLWLMGFLVLAHRSFNPANLLTLPVILGIGVAFGVYVVNRYREERQVSIFSNSTGRAVLLSALTSIAGFASLLGVSHQGLQSLGFTMTVGLSVITVQALVVLPALLQVITRPRAGSPDLQESKEREHAA